jgi:hypothetical protein
MRAQSSAVMLNLLCIVPIKDYDLMQARTDNNVEPWDHWTDNNVVVARLVVVEGGNALDVVLTLPRRLGLLAECSRGLLGMCLSPKPR